MNHFLSALKSAFVTRYASFRGRSGRGELLLCLFVEFLFFAVWIALCCTLLAHALYNWDKIWFTAALILVLTPPLISVHVRRLHDINWNGFWLWLWPVPVAQVTAANSAGGYATVEGALSDPADLDGKGASYKLSDDTGSILVIFWNGTVPPDLQQKAAAAKRVRVNGKVKLYKETLEIVPGPTGVEIVE